MKHSILAIAAVALSVSFAQAQTTQNQKKTKDIQQKEFRQKRAGKFGDRGGEWKSLNLTDAQKQQMKSINETYRAKMDALKKQDQITVKESRDRMAAIQKERKEAMDKVLTADQKAQLAKAKADRMAAGQERQKAQLDKMKNDLNLSDAQVQKIQASRQETAAKMKTLRDNPNLSADQKKAEMKSISEAQRATMKSILTADQLQIWDASRKGPKGEKGMKGDKGFKGRSAK